MDLVFESGASAAPPAAPVSPSAGYPTAGNPATSMPPTKPGPYWFYMIAESMRRVIVEAGLTPDHENLDLLKEAIFSIAPSDASETVKGILEIATAPEAQAFTANKAIDGSALNQSLKGSNQSLTSSGYQKFPGGLIVQWGLYTGSNVADVTVTFPIAFPTAVLAIFTSRGYTAGAGTIGYGVGISISTSQAKFRNSDAGQGYFFLAIGH